MDPVHFLDDQQAKLARLERIELRATDALAAIEHIVSEEHRGTAIRSIQAAIEYVMGYAEGNNQVGLMVRWHKERTSNT